MSEGIGKTIEHKGFVERITDHSVIVKIVSQSACAACHAKGGCTVAELQDKEVEVVSNMRDFIPGEMVSLIMARTQGYKALMIGYVYPFFILFSGLLIANASGLSEIMSGLLALGLLPPYYFIVYLFRNKLRTSFNFSIRKID